MCTSAFKRESIFEQGEEVRRSTILAGMTPEDVEEHEADTAGEVADILCEFEEICADKGIVLPEIPYDIREEMADLAQDMAEFIASKADQEAIVKLIRGNKDDVTYTDEEIENSRVTMLFRWMRKVTDALDEIKPKPGKVRSEARAKALKKMSDAVDMAMSKHDQVLITGHSRLGRVQLPTCIACDRPLAAKKRFKDIPDNLEQGQPHAGVKNHNLKVVRREEAPRLALNMMPPAQQRPETAGAYRTTPSADELYGQQQTQMVQSMSRPGTSDGMSKRPIFGSTGSGQKFVYRGGFKMPKPGTLGGTGGVTSHIGFDLPVLGGGGNGGSRAGGAY